MIAFRNMREALNVSMMNDQTDRIRSQATRYPVLLNLYRHERRSSGAYPLTGSNKEMVVRAFGM